MKLVLAGFVPYLGYRLCSATPVDAIQRRTTLNPPGVPPHWLRSAPADARRSRNFDGGGALSSAVREANLSGHRRTLDWDEHHALGMNAAHGIRHNPRP